MENDQQMKPIKAVDNQYRGINAHLHSYWQAQGHWKEFHTSYIVYLNSALKAQLLPMGYTSAIESSLQLRRLDLADGEPESDIGVFDVDPLRPYGQHKPASAGATASILDLTEVLEYEEEPSEYKALAIYELVPDQEYGQPVAWIEVLSPSNKPGGSHAREYRLKRRKLLDSAIVFVELDYLHESNPTFNKIPKYRTSLRKTDDNAVGHPYRISVIDPRPIISVGKVHLYEFDVDTPVPTILIPLNNADTIECDLDTPYQRTLREEFFAYERVDYRHLPINFDRYSPADQQRIALRMVAVLEAAAFGKELEGAPLPLPTLSLADALKRIQILTT